ncbi:hypothetical protein BYT27DRAFT_7215888 [Phlegmacium glaucopus]|nr:hypothetical protein BYT27DRAFT_7215888 [Phlegmacium glaucopus]
MYDTVKAGGLCYRKRQPEGYRRKVARKRENESSDESEWERMLERNKVTEELLDEEKERKIVSMKGSDDKEDNKPCTGVKQTENAIPSPPVLDISTNTATVNKLSGKDAQMSNRSHAESIIVPAITDPAPSCFNTNTTITNDSDIQTATVNELEYENLQTLKEYTKIPKPAYFDITVTIPKQLYMTNADINKRGKHLEEGIILSVEKENGEKEVLTKVNMAMPLIYN